MSQFTMDRYAILQRRPPYFVHHWLPQGYPESRNVVYVMDLEPLPDEVLLLIFSFLPARDLIANCRCVSQRWKYLVDSPSLWRMKCEHERKTEILRAADMCHDFSWQSVCLKKPFSRNLVRNSCGAEQLQHWHALHRADGWAVENNYSILEGAESQTCFVTSFLWCEKTQIVDLLRAGLWEHFLDVHQPIIHVSDWYAGRRDCGCVYEIKVQLLAVDRKTVIQEFKEKPEPIPQWNDTKYQQVSHEFHSYGPGVRYVSFMHKGKDSQFWQGWYGARISNSSVTLKCRNTEPCTLPCPPSILEEA